MAGNERRNVGSPDSIDFTVGRQVNAADEELAEPGGKRSRYLPRVLALATAALVGAVLATHIHSGGTSQRAAPPPSAPVVAPAVPPPGTGELLADVPQQGARWCPGGVDGSMLCTSTHRVPAAVLAAMRQWFPASHPVWTFEEQLRDVGFGPGGLWYRTVRVRNGGHTVSLLVHRRRVSDWPGLSQDTDARTSTLTVTRIVHGYAVQIRVRGPANRPAGRARAHELFVFAGDARLRASG